MNYVIAGPCGVGKSAVAQALARRVSKMLLDFDALGLEDMKKHPGVISPFSVSRLNLEESLSPILMDLSGEFVLDLGGDNVFRNRVDNEDRRKQVEWLKQAYAPIVIIVLTAQKEIVKARFVRVKNRSADEFDCVWQDWIAIAEPYWQSCGGIFVNTSCLRVDEVVNQIVDRANP